MRLLSDPTDALDPVTKRYSDAQQAARLVGSTITTTASVAAGEFRIITFVASLGTVVITLPTAPPDGTVCKFVRTDGNAYTSFAHITPGGSDVLSTGSSAYNMTVVNAICSFTYVAGTWYPESAAPNMESLTGFSASGSFPPNGVLRNSSGQFEVATPTTAAMATPKSYVDAIMSPRSYVSITTTATATAKATHLCSISTSVTVTLPAAPADGTVCAFVRLDGNIAPSLTIQAGAGDTMVGSNPFVLKTPNSVTFIYDATDTQWVQIANTMNGLSGLLSASPSVGLGSNLVSRDSNGRAQFADPAASTDAANKEYVDIAVATAMQYNGAFNNTSAYAVNDVVLYNNMPYVCSTAVAAPVASSIVGSATFSSSTLAAQNVTLPAGCLAGDAVYLAWAQDSATVPTTPITGATRQGAVVPGNNSVFGFEYTYTLTGTDITNGYVALVAQTNGTVYAGVMWVARACSPSISAANFYTTNLVTNAIGTPSGYPVFTVHATASLTTGTAAITQASLTGMANVNAASGTHSIAVGSGYETLASGTPPARTFTWTNRSTGGGGLTMTLFFVEGGGGTNSNPDADPTHWTLLASEYPGIIKMHGSATPPPGYLLCDGSAVSRTTYAALFAAISTTFGVGDGSTTFNLPPFTSAFPQGNTPGATGGAATHTHTSAAHTHTSAAHTHTSAAHTHPLSTAGYAQFFVSGGGGVAGRNVSVTAWTDQASATVGATATSVSRTTGSPLAGATDSTTPGVTGSTTPGATGSTTPGATGSTSTLPPFVGVAFIIKT